MRDMRMSSEKKTREPHRRSYFCVTCESRSALGCCHTSVDAFCTEDCKKALSLVALLARNMSLAQQHCLNLKKHLHSSIVCMCYLCGGCLKIEHLIVLTPFPILLLLLIRNENCFVFCSF